MYYPMMMNLKEKNVVIIGGGRVAFQKLKGLEHTGANITIISPKITKQIEKWLNHHNVEWICKEYDSTDIEDADIIFATTNHPMINNQIRKDKKKNQLFLQADNTEESDFISPAVVRRGKLVISISTNGASPTLTRKLKKEFENQFDERFGDYIQFLEDARKIIKKQIQSEDLRREYLNRLTEPIFYDLTMKKKIEERNQLFQQIIRREKL